VYHRGPGNTPGPCARHYEQPLVAPQLGQA
jgi:hypothetical protein